MPRHVVVFSLWVCLAVARVALDGAAAAKAAEAHRTTGCLACHQGIEPIREAGSEMLEEIPDRSLAVSLLHHVAEYTDQLPASADDHNSLVHKTLLTAGWVQVVFGVVLALALVVFVLGVVVLIMAVRWYVRRRRRRKAEGAAASR